MPHKHSMTIEERVTRIEDAIHKLTETMLSATHDGTPEWVITDLYSIKWEFEAIVGEEEKGSQA